MPQLKTKLLISLVAVLFVSVLYLLYLNFAKKPEIVYTPQTGNITLPTANPTKTLNLKTYQDKILKVEFQYPSSFTQSITQDGNYYGIDLHGPDFHTQTNDMGTINLGTFFSISNNPTCTSGALVGDKLITTKNNYSIYAVKGYEGPDYKAAVIKDTSGKCVVLNCMSDNLCEGTIYNDFLTILSTFKFTGSVSTSSFPPTGWSKLSANPDKYLLNNNCMYVETEIQDINVSNLIDYLKKQFSTDDLKPLTNTVQYTSNKYDIFTENSQGIAEISTVYLKLSNTKLGVLAFYSNSNQLPNDNFSKCTDDNFNYQSDIQKFVNSFQNTF